MGYADFFLQDNDIQKIINEHCNDFNYNTYGDYLEKCGGYKAYIKSLGGVFAKYADFSGKITSKKELYDCLNYVWGLYNIWGTDYSNGCSYTWEENRYKAKDGAKSAFYPAKNPTARFDVNYAAFSFANGDYMPTVDQMLEKNYAVTNCGQGVVQGLKKTGLIPSYFPDPAYYPKYYADRGYNYKLIKKASDLDVGDVVLFFHNAISNRSGRTSLSNWEDGLFHTAIVGKRDAQYIYMFDSGHAFTYYGECINRRRIGDENVYQWAEDWIAIRFDFIAKLTGIKQGWQKIDGKWYYINEKGIKLTGWQKLNWSQGKDWFYFNAMGEMLTGWQKITYKGKKEWFYLDPASGAMVTGWIRYKDNMYYCDPVTGVMFTGEHTVPCYFNDNGALERK
jgi:hypothetical protein